MEVISHTLRYLDVNNKVVLGKELEILSGSRLSWYGDRPVSEFVATKGQKKVAIKQMMLIKPKHLSIPQIAKRHKLGSPSKWKKRGVYT